MKTKIIKGDFNIVLYRKGGQLLGQENLCIYKVVVKKNGKIVKDGFTSKKAAEQWLGKTIKIANELRNSI